MGGKDHYQRAFEAYLRRQRLPYVSVDEARRSLAPVAGPLMVHGADGGVGATLKSFDFVIYGAGGGAGGGARGTNLLVEVKGRKVARRRSGGEGGRGEGGRGKAGEGRDRGGVLGVLAPPPRLRLESWVTQDDVTSLGVWEGLFGAGFEAVFVFVYWCEEMPGSALFEEFVEHEGRWYAIRCVRRGEYESAMRVRSPRWRTVHLGPEAFDRLSRPLVGRGGDGVTE